MHPLISVVIATKDRPQYLGRLLACVRNQDFADFECLVIDDGSTSATLCAYDDIWHSLDDRFVLVRKTDRQSGGPSRARNRGILAARGTYIAFCDDDDRWVRHDHLSTATRTMTAEGADLFFAAMQMSAQGKISEADLYAPARGLLQRKPVAGESDVFRASRDSMLSLLRHRTLHTDTIVAARNLLIEAGLYWEKTNLAEDRDLSFRIVDRAKKILFRATPVGELEVSPHESLYRTFAPREKALYAYLATLHSEIEVQSPEIRKLCRANRAWDLIDLVQDALASGQKSQARQFAFESLTLKPTWTALRLLAKSA